MLLENLIKTYLLVKYCRFAQKTADIAPGHFPQDSEEIEKWINPEIGALKYHEVMETQKTVSQTICLIWTCSIVHEKVVDVSH